MLKIQANLIHKPTDLRPPACQIEKIILKPHDEFVSIAYDPNVDYRFIKENRDLMSEKNGINHCLLVLDEGGSDGILINAEGYDSIRYGAYVSHARDYIEREMERIADGFMRHYPTDPESGERLIWLGDVAEYAGADAVNDDSEIARMFYSALQKHPGVGSVEAVDDYLVVTPKTDQTQGMASGLKLRDVLLLGDMENVYMVHDTVDVGFVSASHFEMLTAEGREDYAGLLNASVSEIRPGAYGTEIVLTGVDAQALSDFDQAAADHIRAENMMGPTM